MLSRKIASVLVLILIFISPITFLPTKVESKKDYFFTLVAKTNTDGNRPDYLNFLRQYLERIGINLRIINLEWPIFLNEVLLFHDYDVMFIGLAPLSDDPDMLYVFNDQNAYNTFGYDRTMDWNETLKNGMCQWYLEQGRLIMPSNSEERVKHYWDWEQYLMDKIVPMLPTFTATGYNGYWSNLIGYNTSEGLEKCWGKMSWDGLHPGQNSEEEICLSGSSWLTLNPLFAAEGDSTRIIGATMDPLVYLELDKQCYPHLATDFEMLNDTHVRFHLREGIKWQIDPEGLYPDEYFDARDVYFTYYVWKNLSPHQYLFNFIEDMKIVDPYTFDFYIDGDPSTLENELFAPFLYYLGMNILPEHYLNQTQLIDGVTPNMGHKSWQYFSVNCFGTGLFKFVSYIDGVETNLELFDDCWYLDDSVDKTDMDFENRFGNYSSGLRKLKIREIYYQTSAFAEFLGGKIDILSFSYENALEIEGNENFILNSYPSSIFSFYGFNLREDREIVGNREPCSFDNPNISKGLAVRKAIAYAINRVEMNNVIHGGRFGIWDYPIFPNMGIWCNPNIIRYNHDLEMARYYMGIAGYDLRGCETITETILNPMLVSLFAFVVAVIIYKKRKK